MSESFPFEAGPSVETIAEDPTREAVDLFLGKESDVFRRKGLDGLQEYFS